MYVETSSIMQKGLLYGFNHDWIFPFYYNGYEVDKKNILGEGGPEEKKKGREKKVWNVYWNKGKLSWNNIAFIHACLLPSTPQFDEIQIVSLTTWTSYVSMCDIRFQENVLGVCMGTLQHPSALEITIPRLLYIEVAVGPLFSTVLPSNSRLFLSCRPFVVITTLSTGLVGVEVTSVSWLGQLTVGV